MTVGPDGARMRAMTSADLPAVLAIETASQPTPWSEGNFRDCLRGAYRCRVAAVDGEPVGFMILSSVLDERHLLNVAVDPTRQRRGLALWMLADELDLVVTGGSDFHGDIMPEVSRPGIELPEPHAARLCDWLGLR